MQWYPIYTAEVLALPGGHALRYGTWSAPKLLLTFAIGGAAVGIVGTLVRGRVKALVTTVLAAAAVAPFVFGGWGGLLFIAGVVGGNLAGWLSDRVFGSRRAPMAGVLYIALAACCGLMIFARGSTTNRVAWAAKNAGLQVGDEVLSVGGKDTRSWEAVQKAIRLFPAGCKPGAHLVDGTCVAGGNGGDPPQASTIPARVRRAGAELDVALPDTAQRDGKWTMRAGDSRHLSAGPVPTTSPYFLGVLMVLMSLCVLGTHGVLSGTASMDFGGRRAAATATGMIDGAVYLGTALQGFALGQLTTRSWSYWPLFLLPFAVLGFGLTTRIWNASPRKA
jgi:hypothetical protein